LLTSETSTTPACSKICARNLLLRCDAGLLLRRCERNLLLRCERNFLLHCELGLLFNDRNLLLRRPARGARPQPPPPAAAL
jgi:hypothetical protein